MENSHSLTLTIFAILGNYFNLAGLKLHYHKCMAFKNCRKNSRLYENIKFYFTQ